MLLFLSDGHCEKATHAATDARYIWRDRALRSWSPLRVPWSERYTCNKNERQIFYRENWQSHFIHLFGACDSCERGSQRIFKSSLWTRKKNVLGIKWMVSFLFSRVLLKMLAPEEYSFKIVFGLPTWHCDSVEHRRWVVIVKFVTFSYDTLALSFSLNKNLKTVTVWCHNSYRIIFEEKKTQ